jgi:hypothetical protein
MTTSSVNRPPTRRRSPRRPLPAGAVILNDAASRVYRQKFVSAARTGHPCVRLVAPLSETRAN